jgi:xanthine dehydrogenase accessory factor
MDCFRDHLILIKGGGDLASGVAVRLWRAGFPVVMTELPQPLMVRRAVSFGEAAYDGQTTVEGITAQRADDAAAARTILAAGRIPLVIDPAAACRTTLHPAVLIDAIMAKRNTGTTRADAPLVIALGPGFSAGDDCHAVIETNRGHWLGRVIWHGAAQPDTRVPGEVGGMRIERILRAPADGVLEPRAAIGDRVTLGQVVGTVGGAPLMAGCAGVLRGIAHAGLTVTAGTKVGDVDPRAERQHCFSISDKSFAIAGGVLEAVLVGLRG